MKIIEITSKMQDAHQIFIPPFLDYFYVILPFCIVPEVNNNQIYYIFKKKENINVEQNLENKV
jgi:hypothetical protein